MSADVLAIGLKGPVNDLQSGVGRHSRSIPGRQCLQTGWVG